MHADRVIRDSLVKSTKILSGKNINVVMEGFAPRVVMDNRTNKPKEIILPMIPDNCPKPLLDAIMGYQDQQAAHILYSDHKDMADASKDRVWHLLRNQIDTNFVSNQMAKDFPGTHIELKKGYEYLHDNVDAYDAEHIKEMFATNKKAATAGYMAPYLARKMNSDFSSEWYDASPLPEMMKHLDDRMPAELKEALASVNSQQDVRNLCDRVYSFVEELHEELDKQAKDDPQAGDKPAPKKKDKDKDKKPKPDKKDKKEQKDKKKDKDGDPEEGDDEGKDEDDKSDEGEEGEGEGKPDEGEGEGDGDPSDTEADYDEDAPPINAKDLPGGIGDALSSAIGKNMQIEFKKTKGSFFWSDRMNEILTPDSYEGNGRAARYGGSGTITDTNGLDAFDLGCKQVSNYLRKRLERLLESRSRVYRTGGHKSGRLHAKQLFSVPLGNQSVFTKKNDIRALNAAVGLLIDLSGSMNGSKVKLASQSAYTVADCLEKLKVPFECLGFWTDQPIGVKAHEVRKAYEEFCKTADTGTQNRVVNKYAANSTFVFKEFGQAFGLKNKAALMAASKGQIGMANNEDATHLRIALERLSKQPQDKKVLFVFSDGQPAFSDYNTENCRNKLKELATNAQRDYGVTVVGIGIETTSVKLFYPNSKVITNLEELPTAVFDVLTAQLLNRN